MDVLVWAQAGDEENVLSLVRQHPVFSHFSEQFWTPHFIRHNLMLYRRGELLYEIDKVADACYLICSGRVGLLAGGTWGRPTMFAIKSRGNVVGDLSLFDNAPRTSTARALEPSLALTLPYDVVRANLTDNPAIACRILSAYATRIRASDQRLIEALNLDLINRLARLLLEIAQGLTEFELDVTQEEIASLVGASRERTNKALATLQRSGALTIHRHRVYRILDAEKLADLALQWSDDRAPTERLSDQSGPVGPDLVQSS
ncbi:Crp/Fnr family transcriptional regulator [Ferrimicrobium acidiphilum]|uniref:Crp/Fnr family transcriptional regulator n=1 Tax=Ferrimicrobium acidiphilum TaxID=121039 RepID=UPI0023F0B0F9|nr:Crp/Fnr family transcriptional regulator [Ferrimicrobium acidiphilum]MCL5053485.1 Crp/Fnr family transcriptional regulator [Gammaproteobacteria bacterium]